MEITLVKIYILLVLPIQIARIFHSSHPSCRPLTALPYNLEVCKKDNSMGNNKGIYLIYFYLENDKCRVFHINYDFIVYAIFEQIQV